MDQAMDALKAIGKPLVASPERQLEADSDWDIVRRVQAGDVAAFDVLTLRYRGRVYGVIYNMTSNREDAADLTQDAFIKSFQSINRFQGQSSFFTWLYRIAVNSTLTHLRKNRLRTFFSLEKVDENDRQSAEVIEALTDNTGVERNTFVKELQERLNDAMQKLSIRHRTVVTLFEIDGLSHQEIAEIMNCSVGTVRSRLHYAKQQLQSELQPFIRK
jgi:RNA polymerase sigma-70 factor, ECF subfamily|uniref:sigma-70 family RNA polymerase sigma factor n=2 Tax=Cephaloticoccus sp. TaxID=1985742 RepID=UPI004049DD12